VHWKNSLFFKTQRGANVGDLFMSTIHACDLAGANTLDCLNGLEDHAAAVSRQPQLWMPRNHTQQLANMKCA